SPTETGSPVAFNYVDGGCVKPTDFAFTGHPCLLTSGGGCDTPVFSPGVGIRELENKGFSVSSNYPNPFNGSTMVDVTLVKSSDITIEVSNMVGQVLSTKTYKNLTVGKNRLTIEASDLATGLYLY